MDEEDVDDPMEIDDTVPNDSLIIEHSDTDLNTSKPGEETAESKTAGTSTDIKDKINQLEEGNKQKDEIGDSKKPVQKDQTEDSMETNSTKPIQEDKTGGLMKPVQKDQTGDFTKPVQKNQTGDLMKTVQKDQIGDPIKTVQKVTTGDSMKTVQNDKTKDSIKSVQEDIPKAPLEKKDDDIVTILDDDDDDDPVASKNDSGITVSSEVIDLVQRNVINSKCINYSCKSGKDLMRAQGFCLSYYRVKCAANKKKEVCLECYNMAVADYDKLVTEFKAGNVLFNVDVPLRNDMVEIDDSDEEVDEVDEDIEYLDDESAEFISNEIDAAFERVLSQHNIDTHMKKEIHHIRQKSQNLGSQMKEIDANYKVLRSTLDTIQLNLYNHFRPELRELKGVNIIDDRTMNKNTLLTTSANEKITSKPVNKFANTNTSRTVLKSPQVVTTQIKTNSSPNKSQEESTQVTPPADLPKIGPIEKPPISIGETYFVMRITATGPWIRARLIQIVHPDNNSSTKCPMYKLIELKQLKERQVNGKQLAYSTCPKTRLEVGTRVLAAFKEGQNKKTRNFPYYPGIVAEPPIASNNYRYLIFFDIGYSQYVSYPQVYLIYESSAKVWEDMSADSQGFIKKYLESEDHPMIKTAKDQTVRTEYNGRWYLCTVLNVDCSLVQVFFESLSRMEWIYRGSTRLSPIFREEQAASNRQTGSRPVQRKLNSNESNTIVQYTRNTESSQASPPPPTQTPPTTTVRAVARKSTTRPQPTLVPPVNSVPFLPPVNNPPLANLSGPTSKIMYFTPRDQVITKRPYKPHSCSPRCKDYLTHNFNKLRGHNPLSKPLLCGWARMTVKVRGRKEIVYKAPCGRMLRHMGDVHYYLTVTKSEMTVDLFDFNQMVRCLAEFSVDCVPDPKDLSNGLEQVPIPVINGINSEILDFCNYSIKRVPTEGVTMNLDPEFLCGCDCEDDCIDKAKCACWKLTLEGAKYITKDVDPNNVGYIYRRLNDQVLTGIYECNSRCKCSSTCLNRVVQHPLSLKLQVFKTHNRGWGIRALNDVPQGAFICIYAGTIHTEQMANEDGMAYGDEYFAELDYIESVEKVKEDYESDAAMSDEEEAVPDKRSVPSEDEDEEEKNDSSKNYNFGRKRFSYAEDNDFVPSYLDRYELESGVSSRRSLRRRPLEEKMDTDKEIPSVSVKKEFDPSNVDNLAAEIDTVTISDDEDEGREVLSFNPKSGTNPDDKRDLQYMSVRELFGADESVYVMDAKSAGNIGRFLNHSCTPNVFVQNVFVDTHDPRFPWVSFFSSQFIRAGTELVWNYNYDIGSVNGRVLYCYCASLECKGRLL